MMWMGVAPVLAAAPMVLKAESAAARYQLHIAAQPLGSALKEFAAETGLQIARLSDGDDRGMSANAVVGEFTKAQALDILLAGTTLHYRFVNDHTIAILGGSGNPANPKEDSTSPSSPSTPRADSALMVESTDKQKNPGGKSMSRQGILGRMAAFFGLCVAAAASNPACAENDTSARDSIALQEIVVTAQKRADPLSKVPISISAYDEKTLDQEGIRTIADVAALTPGIDFSSQNFGAGNNNFLAVRGILSGNETLAGGNTQDPTGIYIDDVPIQSRRASMSYSGNAFPEVFDLERIEIVRGPQGTLFGAGAEGGAVRFITPQPSLTDFTTYVRAEASGAVVGEKSQEFGMAVGGPIIENALGVRVSAWLRSDGGWIDQVPYNATGQTGGTTSYDNVNSKQTYVFKLAATWAPITGLSITPSVYYQDVKGKGASIFWVGLSNPDHGQFRTGDVLAQPSKDKFILPSLKITGNLGWGELVSNTAYFYRDAKVQNDYTNFSLDIFFGSPYPPAPGVNSPSYSNNSQKNFSEELRLQSVDPNAPLSWVAGLFYSHASQYATQNAILYDNALPPAFADIFHGTEKLVDEQVALFANADYKITQTLKASAGVRVEKDTLDFQETDGGLAAGSAPPYLAGSKKGSPVTPKVVISNQFDERNLTYLSASKGYRLGGVNGPLGSTCGVAAPPTFDADNLWSFEIGDKSRLFGGRLALDVSAYYIDWRHIQQTVTLACGYSATLNLGKATSKGFDLSMQYLVAPGLQISEALGYTDSYYKETVSGAGFPGVLVSKGTTLGVPPWTSTLVARYEFPILDGRAHAYIRPEWIYHSHNSGSSQRQDPAAPTFYDPGTLLDPSTNRINLRAGVAVEKFDVSLFVNNLTNAHPLLSYTHYNVNSPVFEATTFRPLTAGVTAIYRY